MNRMSRADVRMFDPRSTVPAGDHERAAGHSQRVNQGTGDAAATRSDTRTVPVVRVLSPLSGPACRRTSPSGTGPETARKLLLAGGHRHLVAVRIQGGGPEREDLGIVVYDDDLQPARDRAHRAAG